MEPDVIRMYSSSPPPMEDGAEEEDDEFGDFGTFSGGVPSSVSVTEFDTPTTFNQSQALTATSPPELISSRGLMGFNHNSSNGIHGPNNELSKANGIVPLSHLGSGPSERTEMKKALSSSLDFSVSDTAGSELANCNGGGTEVFTNGFATFDVQVSPSSQSSVHSYLKGASIEDMGSGAVGSPEDDFADFAAFSSAEGLLSQTANKDLDNPTGGSWLPEAAYHNEHCNTEQGVTSEDTVRDTNRTGPGTAGSDSISAPAEAPGGSCSIDQGLHTDIGSQQRDVGFAQEAGCTNRPLTLNSVNVADRDDSKEAAGCSESDLSPDAAADSEVGQSGEKGSGNDTETETETSFGRLLSTDALEEYGDMSTTGSVPSPPLQGDTATPADHSQLAEDDEDFGDFGDPGSFGGQGFVECEQLEVQQEQSRSCSSPPAKEVTNTDEDDDFGDFNSPKFHTSGHEGEDDGRFAEFPVSDSFGNFSSAVEGVDGEADAGWSAFGEQQQVEGESWVAFSTEQSVAPPAEVRDEERQESEAARKQTSRTDNQLGSVAPPAEARVEERQESEAASKQTSRTDNQLALLSSRLEKLFQSSFPQSATALVEDDKVVSLKILLEPLEDKPQPGAEMEQRPPCSRPVRVWTQLQDIHEALGLRYQWGGSHCNKALLCCLGIDTRNILFTGQRKQPVIVPMYAAGLGMLEPTKEPMKPVSAAEMIASIAQAPPVAPENSSCPSDSAQEALPPVQFDWSSSGLTNPLDASGGSSLLNLDFFGPVEDSGSTSSPSIPGVDPELYELTTAKLDLGGSGSRVADAFARLMSTVEKTSTSTRKPRKDENLSEESAKVIAGLPDLSFMQAKVLMFPATLMPLGSQAMPE
uniref:aftiphilin a n=1 Tax=Monopterus albus TaxID=43700 RepID=UPI0009B430E0|nr:aftiphilin-like [Monopterus albus]